MRGRVRLEVWICWYKVARQRIRCRAAARAEAQAVKFQEGSYLVLVKWNDVPKANLTALVRTIQKSVRIKPSSFARLRS